MQLRLDVFGACAESAWAPILLYAEQLWKSLWEPPGIGYNRDGLMKAKLQ